MASGQFVALGAIANAIGNEFANRRKLQHEEQAKHEALVTNLVQSGMQSGQIQNPQEAFQWMIDQFGGSKGKGGKAGKPGMGGKAGGGLPPPLQTLIGAVQQAGSAAGAPGSTKTLGGQDRPSFGAPGAAQGQPGMPRFSSPQELDQQAEDVKIRGAKRLANEVTLPEKTAENKLLMERDAAKPPKGVTAGSFAQAYLKSLEKFTEDHGREPTAEESIQIREDLRKKESEAVRRPTAAQESAKDVTTQHGFLTSAVADAEQAAGHPLSNGEKRAAVDKASTEWARNHQGMSFGEKLELARQRAQILQTVGVPTADSAVSDSQKIRIGGQDREYLDLGNFTGEKSKNAAREAALQAGITPVSTQQANQLTSARAALENLDAFFGTIKDKLPPDASGRPLTQIEVPLKQFFQTDEDLASAVAWNITVLPQLRAMNVTGRVPVFEYQQALNAQPKLTDTVGTAAKKLAIVQGVLERGARAVLDRKGTTPAKDAGAAKGIPADVTRGLKDKPAGRRYRVNGTVYEKLPDGTIRLGQ